MKNALIHIIRYISYVAITLGSFVGAIILSYVVFMPQPADDIMAEMQVMIRGGLLSGILIVGSILILLFLRPTQDQTRSRPSTSHQPSTEATINQKPPRAQFQIILKLIAFGIFLAVVLDLFVSLVAIPFLATIFHD